MTEDAYDQAVADWNELQELRIQLDVARKALERIDKYGNVTASREARTALAQIDSGQKVTKAKIREHRGSLDSSMETAREVSSREELLQVISKSLEPFSRVVTQESVHIAPYDRGRDDRIGWEATYIITIDGYGVWGFSDRDI